MQKYNLWRCQRIYEQIILAENSNLSIKTNAVIAIKKSLVFDRTNSRNLKYIQTWDQVDYWKEIKCRIIVVLVNER